MTAQTKPSASIWGVRHVAIKVRDLEAAKHWYGDVLGMTLEDEFPGARHLRPLRPLLPPRPRHLPGGPGFARP